MMSDIIIKLRQHILYLILFLIIHHEASRGAGAQCVTVKPTVWGFDPHSML